MIKKFEKAYKSNPNISERVLKVYVSKTQMHLIKGAILEMKTRKATNTTI